MNCPACSNKLTQITVSNISVDICKNGCGGIWFDAYEFKKFDEPTEPAGEELLNVPRNPNVRVDHSQRIKCPKCSDVVMMRNFFSVKNQVEIDECPVCAGVWLDAGELGRIRELFPSEQARHKAADEYFEELFGSQRRGNIAKEKEKLEKTKKYLRVFKWICPSQYIPGKRYWDTFFSA